MNFALLSDIVREEMRFEYVPNACIAAARITTLTLRRFGVPCQAVACELDAFSPAYVRMVNDTRRSGRDPSDADVARYAAEGAWRVSATSDPAHPGMLDRRDEHGYHAHVVTLAEDHHWLVDPTLGQVDRPDKDLVVERPYAFELTPEDWSERLLGIAMDNGTMLAYRFLPGRRDFVKAPDWRAAGARLAAMTRVIDRVTQRIEEAELARDHRRDADPGAGPERERTRDRALASVPAPDDLERRAEHRQSDHSPLRRDTRHDA